MDRETELFDFAKSLLFISFENVRGPAHVRQEAHCHDCDFQGPVSTTVARCPRCGCTDLDWIDDTAEAF